MRQKLQVVKASYEHPVQMLHYAEKKTERKAAKQDKEEKGIIS